MKALPWSQAAAIGVACAWGFAATSFVGSLRLLPWLLRPEVPWAASAPFAAAIGAKATETTLLLGVPLGCALAAARLARQGNRASARFLVFPTLFTLALGAGAASWRADATQPGRVAIGLLQRTRDSCRGAIEPRGMAVPMVGMSWLCFPDHEPRVVGMLPGSGGRVWFSARNLVARADLSEFTLEDLRLSGDASPLLASASLRVGRARVAGLPVWGRPAKLRVTTRAALLTVVAWVVGLVLTLGLIRFSIARPLMALAAGGGPALLVVVLLERLDRGFATESIYSLLPILGAASAMAAVLLARRVCRWWGTTKFASESGG